MSHIRNHESSGYWILRAFVVRVVSCSIGASR
jgi:hypothetical protein